MPPPWNQTIAFAETTDKAAEIPEVRLKVLRLADRTVVESPPFHVDDLFSDASPPLHWAADGKALYVHASPYAERPQGERQHYQACRFDLEKKTLVPLVEDKTAIVASVLAPGRLLMRVKKGSLRRGRWYVLRLSDRKEFDFPGPLWPTGGRGNRIAAYDEKDRSTRLLEIALPE